MREGKVGIGRDGALQRYFGADISRQEKVDPSDITGNSLGRDRAER